MEMVEVDPKLFVTCRLCLDHLGVYQIVPNVQQQIKFCYDIEVDPFDGLPQLICKTCECILSKYAEIKTTYIDKQKTLKEKLERNVATSLGTETEIQPEQETVSSTQQLASEGKDRKERKNNNFHNASSDKSDTDTSIKLKVKRIKSYKRIKKPPSDIWENNYNKRFVCRFCNKSCKTRSGMIRHINTHSSLLFKYQTCIKSHCSVKLNKVDDKPNICESERIVVHSWNKFIKSEDRFFYTLFRPKRQLVSNDSQNLTLEVLKGEESLSSAESSDNEPFFKVKKKRRRLLSRSSNETVVLEKNNIKDSAKVNVELPSEQIIATVSSTLEQNDAECINIDDSSDTASCKSSNPAKNETNTDLLMSLRDGDYKTIQNIISVCFKKFSIRLESSKGLESSEIPYNIIQKPARKIDSSIKHKVLSIGRKVINNSGFNCTGLLRYLEHQNLEIVWIPALLTHSSHVRIMMKLKKSEENNASDFGWEILQNVQLNNDFERNSAGIVNDQLTSEILNQSTNKAAINKKANDSGLIAESQLNTTEVLTDQTNNTDQITDEKDFLLKKLLNVNHVPFPKQILNASPVANPKQLPKKSNTNENQNKFSNQKQNIIITAPGNESVLTDHVGDSNEHLLMPVITSTVSLAIGTSDVTEEQKSNDENIDLISPTLSNCQMLEDCRGEKINVSKNKGDSVNCEDQQDSMKNIPRIKVKPVSELMSDKALNSMHKHQAEQSSNIINQHQKNNMPYQNTDNVVYMADIVAPQLSNSSNQDLQSLVQSTTSAAAGESTSSSTESNNREYVLMDSVDLPYTRTDSPFRYFKNLLQIHNITLLDANETLSFDFVCLLKFKLVFQQESNVPVVLCLALFNSKRIFCLKIKDANQKDIDISKLSANWQWEILKVYRDVVNKLLQNAEKVSQEVREYTQVYLCLLKSIKFQKLT